MKIEIYNTLKERIIYLFYTPGQILKEQELAKEFGVSRTPLRTVLFRLEWEHLIKILPRTGILVMELELNTITNVFQARLELEGVIGRLAAQRITPDHLGRLNELEKQCRDMMDHKDPSALGHLDMDLKQIFHDACGNPFLTEMSDRLYALTFRLWFFNMVKMKTEEFHIEVETLQNDLSTLSTLLIAKDADKVGNERKSQLLNHLQRIRSTFLGLSQSDRF